MALLGGKKGRKEEFFRLYVMAHGLLVICLIQAHSIMRGFLERNVQKRLGSQKGNMFEIGGVTVLKNHKFFNKIDWQGLVRKQGVY